MSARLESVGNDVEYLVYALLKDPPRGGSDTDGSVESPDNTGTHRLIGRLQAVHSLLQDVAGIAEAEKEDAEGRDEAAKP